MLHRPIRKVRYDKDTLRQCSRLVFHKLCGNRTIGRHCTDDHQEKDPSCHRRRNSIHYCQILLPFQIHLNPASNTSRIVLFISYAANFIYFTRKTSLYIESVPIFPSILMQFPYPANIIKSNHYFLSFICMNSKTVN